MNLAAGHVSIKHHFKGPIGAPVTACAAGVQAIGDAVRLIRNNEADVALCGGAEAAIDKVSLAGFARQRFGRRKVLKWCWPAPLPSASVDLDPRCMRQVEDLCGRLQLVI